MGIVLLVVRAINIPIKAIFRRKAAKKRAAAAAMQQEQLNSQQQQIEQLQYLQKVNSPPATVFTSTAAPSSASSDATSARDRSPNDALSTPTTV